jgi:hypothetical protein
VESVYPQLEPVWDPLVGAHVCPFDDTCEKMVVE